MSEKRTVQIELFLSNGYLDTTKMFKKLKEVVDMDKRNGVKVDRKHPAQKLLNRFSAQYASPSGIKGFRDCPASQILQSVLPYEPSDILSIGTSVHNILENFYNLEKGQREINKLRELMNIEIESRDQESVRKQIEHYINGFIDTPDYLTGGEMNHNELECFNELFLKGDFSPLGVDLPYRMYTLADRVDFRNDKAYIIDYKTGNYLNRKILTMEGYLPQLIVYKWAVEETYGVDVGSAYLLIPGTKQKIAELDVSSLENQSRMVDIVFEYKEESQKAAESRLYPVKNINKWVREKLDKYAKIEKFDDFDRILIDYDISLS